MEVKKYTCIVCPMSCDITLSADKGKIIDVSGFTCKRGENFLRLFQKHAGWKPTLASCVVKPNNVEEVSKILKYTNENNIPVIPYGGGSEVLGGAETREEGTVVIDLSNINQIIELNENNLSVCVQGGVYLKDLEPWLNDRGYITGHYPQSIDLAEIGGLVATRSIGQFSTKYGGIEDLVLGLEAVLPNGEIVRIKSNPRRSVGPDLRQLWLGSEGMLGIITEVTLKVFPEPEERWLQSYAIPTIREGLEVIRKVMRAGYKPPVVRLHDWLECEKPYGAFMNEGECILLFLSEGSKELCELEGNGIDKIVSSLGGRPLGSKPVEIWLAYRNDAADEYEQYGAMGVLVDTIEVSANWDNIADIYEETIDRIYYEVSETIFFSGHSSHSYMNGTNIYFQMGALPKKDIEDAERVYYKIWQIVMETTLKYGGSIGHHHGVGKHRTKWVEDELGSSYVMMETIKNAFDPNSIMNPGVIVKVK